MLRYDRNIIRFLLRNSLVIFGNLRKMFGHFCLEFGQLSKNLREVHGNLRKIKKGVNSMRI